MKNQNIRIETSFLYVTVNIYFSIGLPLARSSSSQPRRRAVLGINETRKDTRVQSSSFPLPSLRRKHDLPGRPPSSLDSYRVAWDTMSQKSRKLQDVDAPERKKIVQEGFAKALLFNKIPVRNNSSVDDLSSGER